MKIAYFPEVNVEIAKDQPEYQTLPAYIVPEDPEGRIVCKYLLSVEELQEFQINRRLFLMVSTFGNLLQPCLMAPDLPSVLGARHDDYKKEAEFLPDDPSGRCIVIFWMNPNQVDQIVNNAFVYISIKRYTDALNPIFPYAGDSSFPNMPPPELVEAVNNPEGVIYQIEHSTGWSDLRPEEIPIYKNSNANIRIKPERKIEWERGDLIENHGHAVYYYAEGTADDGTLWSGTWEECNGEFIQVSEIEEKTT